jgi:multiple sugar transport system substrate-binding protein
MKKNLRAAAFAFASATASSPETSHAQPWSLASAATPLKGTTINALFLDRPGYPAIIKLLPEFEQQTGIKVKYDIVPYENAREREVLNFNGQGDLDVALIDQVWIGEFGENKWVLPISTFTKDPKLADPALNLNGFFPLLLNAFGTWGGTVYGLPFDNYSGLLFYNKCQLKDAEFDRPPQTWDEVLKVYAPKMTDPAKNRYGFAL